MTATLQTASTDDEPMTHRQTMEALSGLLLVLFVAMLSATVVSTALPQIIGALDGSQTQYTWVVTATLPAATGYLGGVMALATVGGPLLGGVIVDTDWLGWRWCFFVGVPIALVALLASRSDAGTARPRPAC